MTVAVSEGNMNVRTFVMDQYPGCLIVTFADENACFEAVAKELADVALVSNYRIPSVEEALERNRLYSVPTGEHIPFSFAVRQEERVLYFLLNKTVLTTKSEDMDSAPAA